MPQSEGSCPFNKFQRRSIQLTKLAPTAKREDDTATISETQLQTKKKLGPKAEKITTQDLEIKTKLGNLLVRTTLDDTKLTSIVIENPKTENVQDSTISEKLNDEQRKNDIKDDLIEKIAEKNKQLAKKRVRVDFSRSSLERNFITPNRATTDFLLKAADLEVLPKTKRRSPYEQEPPITVYWRKDVEAKAIEVWGSRENLLKECLKREIEKKTHQQSNVSK